MSLPQDRTNFEMLIVTHLTIYLESGKYAQLSRLEYVATALSAKWHSDQPSGSRHARSLCGGAEIK